VISHPCAPNLLGLFSVMPERESKIISPQPKKQSAKAKEFTVADLPRHLRHINVNAAGIDIGSDRHLVAVPEGRDVVSVREFKAFTADLHALADWLSHCGVTTVAMESTGVYWIPLYEILERRGFQVYLVDARRVKNVSGRKSDVLDCQWTQELHTYGLLVQAFRPPEEIRVLQLSAPESNAGTNRGGAHSTYAEGPAANELAFAQRGLRHHWRYRNENSQSDYCWRT